MNFDYGGSVLILDKGKNDEWFLVKKFGYIAYIVEDDINAMKWIVDSPLFQLSLKRKVKWYEIPYYRPNLEQFKEMILK